MEVAVQVGASAGSAGHGIEPIVAQAQLAESLGFAAVFVPDHYVYEEIGLLQRGMPAYDPFFVLATLAQRTRRIRIGTHVACALFRHPAMHARLFAQIDEASGGRVIAGIGAGWQRTEFAMMGITLPPVSERLRILDEAAAIMRGLWRGEPFTFAGEHFAVRDAVCLPVPAQKPGPPLMLGGSGNGILRRAGAWADIVHLVPRLASEGTATLREIRAFDDDALGRKVTRVRSAERDAGRAAASVRLATTVFSYVATRTSAETERAARRVARILGGTPEEALRHPSALVGTPEEMVREIRRRQERHGLALLVLNLSHDEQLRQFSQDVLTRIG